MMRVAVNAFLLGMVLVTSLLMPVHAADPGLDAMELQVFGRKYGQQPMEQRISRLEQKMGLPALPKTSTTYRLSQLYLRQRNYISEEAQHRAIAAFNQGVDAESHGNLEAAKVHYREALLSNPTLIQASNNLGNILNQQERFDEAIGIYEAALRYASEEPLLYRNLGVIYERVGKIAEALETYRMYLKLSKQPDPPIEAIVSNYDRNRSVAKPAAHYAEVATNATGGKALLWPEKLNPIGVYIQIADDRQSAFIPTAQKAFSQWETASGGRLRFKEVLAPDVANIIITLKEGPLSHPFLDVGHAKFNVDERLGRAERMQVNITVNTGEEDARLPMPYRAEQVSRLMLHELGHAIGIWGHSPDPGDIMFTHPIVSKLSERDMQTIRKLYARH